MRDLAYRIVHSLVTGAHGEIRCTHEIAYSPRIDSLESLRKRVPELDEAVKEIEEETFSDLGLWIFWDMGIAHDGLVDSMRHCSDAGVLRLIGEIYWRLLSLESFVWALRDPQPPERTPAESEPAKEEAPPKEEEPSMEDQLRWSNPSNPLNDAAVQYLLNAMEGVE